ncbi:MAG: RNA 2',3'-cyclic phosphodiesterase [Flavobacteriales bacterium]|nr:RNA 2',3'-cyclic phosphodiesterase [Flavobacteriales bacterium]
MRIFIGTAVQIGTAKALSAKLGDGLYAPFWRVAPMAQWHVTALFIGERPETVVPVVSAAVAKLASSRTPILLEDGRLVTMPKQDPSMLWIRFRPNTALTALHVALADATGTEPSIYRPYWPHITLARAKTGKPGSVDGPVVLPSFLIDHLTLFRSTPSPGGSVHQPIASWPLTGTVAVAPEEAD